MTKQFPVYWDQGRQVRIGVQRYLMSVTANSEVTLSIYLSQDDSDPWTNPKFSGIPNGLVYSQVLFTCPESTNLGLTPANINLQMVTAVQQSQIWHRVNTSLLGDTIQIGFSMNDQQMRDTNFTSQFAEIELHGMILDVSPSSLLA